MDEKLIKNCESFETPGSFTCDKNVSVRLVSGQIKLHLCSLGQKVLWWVKETHKWTGYLSSLSYDSAGNMLTQISTIGSWKSDPYHFFSSILGILGTLSCYPDTIKQLKKKKNCRHFYPHIYVNLGSWIIVTQRQIRNCRTMNQICIINYSKLVESNTILSY